VRGSHEFMGYLPISKMINIFLIAAVSAYKNRDISFLAPHDVEPTVHEKSKKTFIAFPLLRSKEERQAPVSITHSHATHPSYVQLQSGTSATVARKDFYLPIVVGLPAQHFLVTVDSGSGNLVLPTVSCPSAACKNHHTYDQIKSGTAQDVARIDDPKLQGASKEVLSFRYGHGYATGNVVSDVVCLGSQRNLCAEDTHFLAAFKETKSPFALLPYDGILGVGLPATSVTPRFNIMGNLAEKKALLNDRFAIWMANEGDGEPSEVTFGDFNPKRLASTVIWEKIDDASTGFWQVPAEIMVDNEPIGLGIHRFAVDTGTSLIAGPGTVIEAIKSGVNLRSDCSNYHNLPLVGFKFGSTILNLEPADYVGREAEGTICKYNFATLELPSGIILLGDPFMRKYYTIYDRDSLQVGLSLSNHTKSIGNLPIDQLVVRL